ncbi:MAG: glycoside hydrolase family 130 protein [Thermotogota bacterium]|nr:glycoside hydrolase family 130 protein [Thermotogota bacterium]
MKSFFTIIIICFSITVLSLNFDFEKVYEVERISDYPILLPEGIGFESKAVFNPGAIVVNDEIMLIYRAEDWSGVNKWNGTSSLGIAESKDGILFKKEATPILMPTETYEIPGGCEDPRIVKIDDTYLLTYTGYNGTNAKLCLAYSKDFENWVKVGPIIKTGRWSKSGAIIPKKIDGKYCMYFGDSNIYLATSNNLRDWQVNYSPVLSPRSMNFDSRLVEPGPPPLITDEGILLFYNSADFSGIYRVGAALFDINNPANLLKRTDKPIFEPELSWEKYGQVPNVVFFEGTVIHNDTLFIYYGAADTYTGAARIKLN